MRLARMSARVAGGGLPMTMKKPAVRRKIRYRGPHDAPGNERHEPALRLRPLIDTISSGKDLARNTEVLERPGHCRCELRDGGAR
jgi:hypothetical protein